LRIIYLHQYFNTPVMEGSTRSYEMARRLVERGHVVEMVTTLRDQDKSREKQWFQTVEDRITVHWLPLSYSNKMSYRERINSFFQFAWKASLKAASLQGDLIFATSTPLTIALPAVYAARKKKLPLVFEVRDLWPELPIAIGALKNPAARLAAKKLELFAYKNSTAIVALSPGMKEGIVKTGYPAGKVTVIPNGCDLEFFSAGKEAGPKIRQEHPWLQDRPLVIYAGTIGIINGVDYLARVAGAMQELNPEICFLVLGSGKGEQALIAEAKKQDVLEKNLFVRPGVPKQAMPAWLAAADLATSLFLDLEEMQANSANKFFDALAAGKPVAINYNGWQARHLRESGAGLVLPPDDPALSAKMIAEKIGDQTWLEQAGQAARKLAENNFEYSRLAGELEQVLLAAGSNRTIFLGGDRLEHG